MQLPATPVHRLQHFRPPFCPHRDCPDHHVTRPREYRFRRRGSYSTSRSSSIPRFVCRRCGRSFSRSTFSTRYFLKRPELLVPVASGLVAGCAHRQIARTLGCAPSTVTRLSARLGRHCLLVLSRALSHLRGRLCEPVVIDHFETFELTQDLPFGIATAVGSESWFVYALDPAPHGRGGRRSPAQKRRARRLPPRPARGGYHGSARRLIGLLSGLPGPQEALHLIGDGHPAYTAAVRRLRRSGPISLEQHPVPPRGPKGSPRSPRARARDRAMFPGDVLHALFRHSMAHHRRETIAFGRRLNALMERIFVAAVWRNWVKRRSERRPEPVTAAMRLGLAGEPWGWTRVLSRRLFPLREKVPDVWAELYRREWKTAAAGPNTVHRLRYAH